MRILIVEDTAALARSLAQGLSEEGFAVDVAGDGEEGLHFATEVAYDAIVLDRMLPGLDGLTVLRRARERGCGRRCCCSPRSARSTTGWPGSTAAPTTTW